MIYLRLFWEFFKAGLFAVGGGLGFKYHAHLLLHCGGRFCRKACTPSA